MTERDRMLSGQLYNAGDPALTEARQQARILTYQFNNRDPLDPDYALRQQETLQALLGRLGQNCWIEAPFRCDYGSQIAIGDWFYANYDCIFLDIAHITIGSHVFFGPRVCLYTAGHPTVPEVRDLNLEYGRPITIGDSVWIGGNTVVLPGVTIGSGSVIAAGSVVNRDIPAGVLAGGVPCRVIRPLTDEDRAYWKARQQADHQ